MIRLLNVQKGSLTMRSLLQKRQKKFPMKKRPVRVVDNWLILPQEIHRFELTKIDPLLYEQVVNLKEGEVSKILTDQDNTGRPFYKIITVTNRYPEHKANYAQDYNKIKELALRDKQLEAIEKWQKEKISETYIKVNGEYRNCEFTSNWLKN